MKFYRVFTLQHRLNNYERWALFISLIRNLRVVEVEILSFESGNRRNPRQAEEWTHSHKAANI